MAKLKEVAKYIRTKNAGPFWVTIEIFCPDSEAYEKAAASAAAEPAVVGRLYGVPEEKIEVYRIPSLYVVKISFPRPFASGYRYEWDMHYGQQYRLLAELEIG